MMGVSSVDVNSGSYVTFNEKEPLQRLPAGVVASASIPLVFPHRNIKSMTLMDGGVIWNTNLSTAVNRCKELVDDDSQIVVDIILCFGSQLDSVKETGNAIDNFLRYQEISFYYDLMNDVVEFKRLRPEVNYRYLLMPSEDLGYNLLDFTNSTMFPMAQLGMADAEKVMGMGEGAAFDLLEEYVSNPELKKDHKSFNSFLYSYTQ